MVELKGAQAVALIVINGHRHVWKLVETSELECRSLSEICAEVSNIRESRPKMMFHSQFDRRKLMNV